MMKQLLVFTLCSIVLIAGCTGSLPKIGKDECMMRLKNGQVNKITIVNNKTVEVELMEDKGTRGDSPYIVEGIRDISKFPDEIFEAQKNLPPDSQIYPVYEERKSVF